MIVVTGANGLVGANHVRALLSGYPLPGGSRLRALVLQDRRALQGLDVELVQVDSNNVAALQHVFIGAELVFHLAGAISLSMDSWNEVSAVNLTAHGIFWKPVVPPGLAAWSLGIHPRSCPPGEPNHQSTYLKPAVNTKLCLPLLCPWRS